MRTLRPCATVSEIDQRSGHRHASLKPGRLCDAQRVCTSSGNLIFAWKPLGSFRKILIVYERVTIPGARAVPAKFLNPPIIEAVLTSDRAVVAPLLAQVSNP